MISSMAAASARTKKPIAAMRSWRPQRANGGVAAGDEQRRHQQDQRAIQPLPLKPAHLSLTPRTGAISGDIMAAPRGMPVSFSTSSDIRADRTAFRTVIPGLDPGIHAFAYRVDGRVKPGHDEGGGRQR